MKKILMFALVVSAVAFVHGAAINWQLASIKGSNGSLIGATSGKYSAVATLFDADGAQVKQVTINTSNAMSIMTGQFTDTALSTKYYAQIVLTEVATGMSVTSEKAELTTSAAATYTINFTNGTGFSTQSSKIDFSTYSVPEPTSGLLLLLGVAGLALKRKRA